MRGLLTRGARWFVCQAGWEVVALAILMASIPFLAFYNLQYNPRPWHDEGSFLAIPKTLVQDGRYASRNSDGYQTFGAVQSLGPTVLLPIALSFKLFGIGLVQARFVSAAYLVLMLAVFFLCGRELFGRRVGIIATVMVMGSPAVGLFLYGRPVMGEVAALGFMLSGWLAWARGVRTRPRWLYLLSGLLLGAAMVTKTQYTLMGFGTLGLLALLDLVFYKQGHWRSLIFIAVIALICVAAWWAWQIAYFGMATFSENAAKLRVLAASTTGFHLDTTVDAIKALVGSGIGHLYFFWGFLALAYVGFFGVRRSQASLVLAFLWLFACLWFAYYTFWIIPWSRYVLPAAAITALFVAKLFDDLARGLVASHQDWREIQRLGSPTATISPKALMSVGTLVALITMSLLVGYQLQQVIRSDVLDKVGVDTPYVVSPPQLQDPYRMAALLNQTVDKDSLIETWERELGILTDHRYHFPDQSLLAETDSFVYHGGSHDYVLGSDYFRTIRPAYVVVGWYARFNQIYDMDYLSQHAELIATVGDGDWRYDLYKMQDP